ncbi:MAG: RNA methyltransferase [Acidobacteriota bacterium]
MALVHYPVLNKRGETIPSAITNLDLHDLARLACTFDLPACYMVTPLKDQQQLSEKLLSHWRERVGKELHPDRERALRRLRVVDSIEAAREDIRERSGTLPKVWATTAREEPGAISISEARRRILDSDSPRLLLLGTGWGLAPSVIEGADAILEPIRGFSGYNHLSVRCAAAIILDRLLCTDRT